MSAANFNKFKSPYVKNYQNNKEKLSNDFSKDLSRFIQEIGEKCYLKHISNAFRTGKRKNSAYWRGLYKCQSVGCASYTFEIENFNEKTDNEVLFECQISGPINHAEKLRQKTERIYGDKRSELVLKIMQEGGVENAFNSTIQSQMSSVPSSLLSSNEKTKIKDVYRKIKEEFSKPNFLFSYDILKDTMISGAMLLRLDTISKNIKGYVQHISSFPFGFLMMCEVLVLNNIN